MSVPTSGPVQQVSPNAQRSADGGVRIDAEGPRPGATPEIVVAGFLNAMASLAPGFDIAREYLTDKAREQWDPTAGVTVTDAGSQQLISTASSEVITAPLVGRVDRQGRYLVASGRLRHDFAMTRVNGEWRIANAPSGLLISSATFSSYYTPVTVWFLSQDGSSMVPETLQVPLERNTPTAAVTALLQGPSRWLASQVDTAFPTDTRMASPAVASGSDGTADVAFDADLASLPDTQRQRLALQVAWTLQQFDSLTRVRITAGGQPLVAAGVLTNGTADLTGFLPRPPVASSSDHLLVVRDGKLGEVAADGHFTAATVVASSVVKASSFAASDAGGRVVWADGDVLRSATQKTQGVLARGMQWGVPQVLADGTTWVSAVARGQRVLLRIPAAGKAVTVALTGVPAGTLRAFQVSPDGARAAVVVQQGSRSVVGLVAVGERSGTLGAWYPITNASSQLVDVRDVVWTEATQLAVLASTSAGGQTSVFALSQDGASVTTLGPVASTNPQRLVSQPLRDGVELFALTSDGTLLRCDDAWRWNVVSTKVTAVAMSS